MESNDERLSRRSLVGLGGLAAAALAGGGLRVPESQAAPVSCVLTPEQTEGPYYIDGEKVRRDITEGKPGVALRLRTTVVDAPLAISQSVVNPEARHAAAMHTNANDA